MKNTAKSVSGCFSPPPICIKTSVFKALCSLLRSIIEWRDDGHPGQDAGENFSIAAAQESMTLS